MPNKPAKPGKSRLAPGMLIGELAGKAVGPMMVHPNKPASKKKAVSQKSERKLADYHGTGRLYYWLLIQISVH